MWYSYTSRRNFGSNSGSLHKEIKISLVWTYTCGEDARYWAANDEDNTNDENNAQLDEYLSVLCYKC